jgi:hypothetical protein
MLKIRTNISDFQNTAHNYKDQNSPLAKGDKGGCHQNSLQPTIKATCTTIKEARRAVGGVALG